MEWVDTILALAMSRRSWDVFPLYVATEGTLRNFGRGVPGALLIAFGAAVLQLLYLYDQVRSVRFHHGIGSSS
jgi:hypothetical protein